MQHEIPTIDPAAVTLRFFLKALHPIARAKIQSAVSPGWACSRDRRLLTMLLVKLNQGCNIHVTDTIAISEAERFLFFDIALHSLQTATGQGVLTSIDQRNHPGFRLVVMHLHSIVFHGKCDIRHV